MNLKNAIIVGLDHEKTKVGHPHFINETLGSSPNSEKLDDQTSHLIINPSFDSDTPTVIVRVIYSGGCGFVTIIDYVEYIGDQKSLVDFLFHGDNPYFYRNDLGYTQDSTIECDPFGSGMGFINSNHLAPLVNYDASILTPTSILGHKIALAKELPFLLLPQTDRLKIVHEAMVQGRIIFAHFDDIFPRIPTWIRKCYNHILYPDLNSDYDYGLITLMSYSVLKNQVLSRKPTVLDSEESTTPIRLDSGEVEKTI